MRVLVYGINYAPELTGIGKYSGEMAAWLASEGHQVAVITAPPYYPDWRVHNGHSNRRFTRTVEYGVTVYRCPLYVPAQPSAFKRILHLISFSMTSCVALFRLRRWRPNLVIYVVPTLFCALQTLLYARLTGAKVILHVQDYEIDALFGLRAANFHWLRAIAYWVERLIMRAFDRVSTISPGMMARAVAKGASQDALLFFPNWSEIERFTGVLRSPSLLEHLGVDPANKVVMYSGNIGDKQGLEMVLDAAFSMQALSNYIFLLVGEGGGKSRLQALAAEMNLKNVIFSPLLSYEELPALLASADCHLVVQKRGVADAVLPSKLTNILAVGGNAVITADAETSLGQLCREYPGIAVCVTPESVNALVAGIHQALSMPRRNHIASNYARDHLDKKTILARFINQV